MDHSLFIHLTSSWLVPLLFILPGIWQDPGADSSGFHLGIFRRAKRGQKALLLGNFSGFSTSSLPGKFSPLSPASLHSRTSPSCWIFRPWQMPTNAKIPQQWTPCTIHLWNLFLLWLCFSPQRAWCALGLGHRNKFPLEEFEKEMSRGASKWSDTENSPEEVGWLVKSRAVIAAVPRLREWVG